MSPSDTCQTLEVKRNAAIKALVEQHANRIVMVTRAEIFADPKYKKQEEREKAVEDAVVAAQKDLDAIESEAADLDIDGWSKIDNLIQIERKSIPEECDKSWENVRKTQAIEQQKHNTVVQAAFPKRFFNEPESFIDWARARARLVTVQRVQGIL